MSELDIQPYYHPEFDDGSTRGLAWVKIDGLPGMWTESPSWLAGSDWDAYPDVARADSAASARKGLATLAHEYGDDIPQHQIEALVSRINDAGRIIEPEEARKWAEIENPHREKITDMTKRTYAMHAGLVEHFRSEAGDDVAQSLLLDRPLLIIDPTSDVELFAQTLIGKARSRLSRKAADMAITLECEYEAAVGIANDLCCNMNRALFRAYTKGQIQAPAKNS